MRIGSSTESSLVRNGTRAGVAGALGCQDSRRGRSAARGGRRLYHHHYGIGDFDRSVLTAPSEVREERILRELHRMEQRPGRASSG